MIPGMARRDRLVLLTGASGYVGGRLLRELEKESYALRCLARKPEYLKHRIGARTQVVSGDVFDIPSMAKAMEGMGYVPSVV